ncbi:MAG: hypothetical protein HN826_09165 [Methylococcales bacterium]|nr:hypothetical protein [Methylococcales bacterium]
MDDEINGSCNFGDHNIEWSAKAIKNQAEYMCGAADMGYRISVSIGGKLVLSSVTLADSLWCSRGVSSVELNGYYRCDLRKPGGCIEMHLSPVKEDVFIDYNGPIDMEWLDKYLCTDKCSKYVYVSNVALEIKPLKE